MRLVLIGGGYARESEHFSINQRLAELTGKEDPDVLFIPTAAADDEEYIKEFRTVFENCLGCKVSVLRTRSLRPSDSDAKKAIQGADLIYLGGGNYLNMMETWKTWKIDQHLIHALQTDTLIAGISAGAICWFTSGLRSDYEGDGYVESEGWHFIDAVFCPHFNQPERSDAFTSLLEQSDRKGLAIEDNCALYLNGDAFEIIGSPSKIHTFGGLSFNQLTRHIHPI